jgi:hypothetical protein
LGTGKKLLNDDLLVGIDEAPIVPPKRILKFHVPKVSTVVKTLSFSEKMKKSTQK